VKNAPGPSGAAPEISRTNSSARALRAQKKQLGAETGYQPEKTAGTLLFPLNRRSE
jgi:hypothetical protein